MGYSPTVKSAQQESSRGRDEGTAHPYDDIAAATNAACVLPSKRATAVVSETRRSINARTAGMSASVDREWAATRRTYIWRSERGLGERPVTTLISRPTLGTAEKL
jgi:hypothetical protein